MLDKNKIEQFAGKEDQLESCGSGKGVLIKGQLLGMEVMNIKQKREEKEWKYRRATLQNVFSFTNNLRMCFVIWPILDWETCFLSSYNLCIELKYFK